MTEPMTSSLIDPAKLPAKAVEAAQRDWSHRQVIAVFLETLMGDDAALNRALFAWGLPRGPSHRAAMRGALLAAFQEDQRAS